VAVVHPWEVSGRPTPGPLSGIAKFIHETGRPGFEARFRDLLRAIPWKSIRSAAGLDFVEVQPVPMAGAVARPSRQAG
jgi:hypothetical protein